MYFCPRNQTKNMKHYLFATILVFIFMPAILCANEPFRGTFVAKELGLKMVIDLYNESIEVPEMEMFGPMNGYIRGAGLYRTWYISKIRKCGETLAIVHFSNDLGSETQPVELTLQGDSLLHFHEIEGSVMKKAEGKKLVKILTKFTMKRE